MTDDPHPEAGALSTIGGEYLRFGVGVPMTDEPAGAIRARGDPIEVALGRRGSGGAHVIGDAPRGL